MDRIAVSAESKIRFVILRVGRGTDAHSSRLTLPAHSWLLRSFLPLLRPVAGAAQPVAGPGQRTVPNLIISGGLAGGPSGSASVRLTSLRCEI